MDASGLPFRPRLADHAMARRHFIDGAEIIVVHDTRSGDLVRMPPRAWALIEAADGTRELGGLVLAAAQKGALQRTSEVVSVLSDLQAAGLLTDGIDPFAFEEGEIAGVDARTPLDVLAFSLVCDGSGSCCATYGSVRFSEDEAARARALLPNAAGGRARAFLPLHGSGAQPQLAAPAIDGRCAYHASDGACELHRTGGAGAKPSGCAVYPATFVFDGEALRVSAGVECACIEKSIGRRDGAPLVPERAEARGDLPPGVQIAVLPEVIELAASVTAPRAEVVRWSRAVLRALPAASGRDVEPSAARWDAVAALWALAAKVEAGDLSEDGARAALEGAKAPAPEALAVWAHALADRTAARRDSADRWRSERDRVRVASRLLAEAAASLRDPATLGAALAERLEPELFYVTACIHGHALVGEVPLAHALRDRAARVLLARAVPAAAARIGCDDPGREHPLSLVEAMMRAQGLKEYARLVPL